MSMTTQCPSCSTTFRVTPQQLQSQHGMVRCGRCATVFDGFKVLATLPVVTSPEPAPRAAGLMPAVEAMPPSFRESESNGDAGPVDLALPEPVATPAASAPAVAAEQDTVSVVAAEPAMPVETASADTAVEVDAATVAPSFAAEAVSDETSLEPPPNTESILLAPPRAAEPIAEPASEQASVPLENAGAGVVPAPTPVQDAFVPHATPPRRRSMIWAGASLFLLLLLGAQFVYLYRGDLAASVPEMRPLLNEGCRVLNCAVALPQRPRQITIEASDMQAADTANPGLVVLTATLRNQATIALGYPALDVVLTNTREHTVARRIFLPAEYLLNSKDARAGLAPSAEVTIRLNIDSGDLGAAGFRLDLMAAPAG